MLLNKLKRENKMQIKSLMSNNFLSNTFIVENNNKCLIFDCGASVRNVKQLINNCEVEAIFITHGHFDHIYNLDEYVKAFNCDVFCTEKCFEKFKNADKNLSNYFLNNSLILNQNNYMEVKNEVEIKVANLIIKPYILTGHSNCSVAYKIENNLICGDIIFKNGVGRTDFYDSNPNQQEKSINKIKMLAPLNVYCGHGENFNLR